VSDRIWEDLVLALLGDQFDECKTGEARREGDGSWSDESSGSGLGEWPEICGCTISVRQSEDIVSLWNRVDGDSKVNERIRDTIRQVLNLPPDIVMKYKTNNDSFQDKSSFRHSGIDRTPSS
jgi:translation initiation factor 4E